MEHHVYLDSFCCLYGIRLGRLLLIAFEWHSLEHVVSESDKDRATCDIFGMGRYRKVVSKQKRKLAGRGGRMNKL